MPLMSTGLGGGTDFEPVPAGTHIARCISVIDFGFQETPHGPKQKVYLGFEVPSVRVEWKKKNDQGVEIEYEGAALIGSTYTNSVHPKSILGQHLVNWRGRDFTDDEREGFDLFTIVGVVCMISVTHNVTPSKTYANVSGIMGVPPGVIAPDLEAELLRYSASDPSTNATFSKLPEWMQKKCNAAVPAPQVETPPITPVTGMVAPAPLPDDFDDSIPF